MDTKNYYKFNLSFKGQLVENSVDAFDVANTILATSRCLQEISIIYYGEDFANKIGININAFEKGSLESPFLIYIRDTTAAMLPLIAQNPQLILDSVKVGKTMLGSLKTIIDIRNFLKGKAPKEIKQISPTEMKIINIGSGSINVNYNDFRGVQSKEIQKNMAKMVEPMLKPQSQLSELSFSDETNKKIITIDQERSIYLQSIEATQAIPSITYKGIVSKIDTKVFSGFFDIGSKRLAFNYQIQITPDEFDILIESLRTKIQIYLTGDVTMDYQSNPKHMVVTKIQKDLKLIT